MAVTATSTTCPSCGTRQEAGPGSGRRCGICGASTDVDVAAALTTPSVVRRQELNPAQHDAVYQNGNLLITACPGSGKTFVLRERAIRKLKESPSAVGVAVTFTREAAQELETRVMLAYPEGAGRLLCGTFHSLCMRQLRQAGIDVNLVNDTTQNDLLHRAWKEVVGEWDGEEELVRPRHLAEPTIDKVRFESVRQFVAEMKSNVHAALGDPATDPYTRIYLRYQELLRMRGSMDFNDMLVLATQKMASGEVQPLVGAGAFMLVDEAQDSDNVQLGWVRAHMQHGVEIAAVGDDDQSVYSFRFCRGAGGMTGFAQWARASHISLDITYRCAREILEPAARLIAFNVDRIDKALRTANHARGQVRQIACANLDHQISQMIRTIVASGRPGDWAIICRTNRIGEAVEKAVRAAVEAGRGFPLTRHGGKSFWELQGPALYLGLCRSLWFDNMDGVDPFLRYAGVNERRISRLHAAFPPRQRGSLSQFLAQGLANATEPEETFRLLAGQWRTLMARRQLGLACMGISDYMQTKMNLVAPGSKDTARMTAATIGAIRAAAVAISRLAQSAGTNDGIGYGLRTLGEDFGDAGRTPEPQLEAGAARLLTFHSAKGLEFPNVWLIACDDQVIPSRNSVNEEEERRLFYVGMTRAKQVLVMSHTVKKRSPFIGEAGV